MSIANDPAEPDDLCAIIPTEWAGQRLDAVLAQLFPTYSRSRLSTWLKAGYVEVNGAQKPGKSKVIGQEQIRIALPEGLLQRTLEESMAAGELVIEPEEVPLEVVHKDESVFILNKQANLVMHPAPGNRHGTVMNGLLHMDENLAGVPRAGVVHRLDKDTTGLCVVARSLEAHTHLVRQLQARTVSRVYFAVVAGDPPQEETIDEPIGRHPKNRQRMAVVGNGKRAITHFSVLQRFPGCALVRVQLETGRTHQIRVHMTHMGFPLVGDSVYQHGRALQRLPEPVRDITDRFQRQALHAGELGFNHPSTDEPVRYEAAMPNDMQQLVSKLSELVDGPDDDGTRVSYVS